MWTRLYKPSSAVPVGELRRSSLPLSRREFLGFLAATPAVPSLSSALAAERPDDSKLDLAFDLSADGRSLRVVRVDPQTREPTPGLKTLDMSVDMFGQNAWFDVAPPISDAKRRKLYIRNISYGDLVGRKIELLFQNAGGWKLRILTDVWLDSDGNTREYETETPVFLDDFIEQKFDATETLWASRISQTFRRMFAGRIDAGNGKESIQVGLTGKFQWRLRTLSKPLRAFAGQIAVTEFSLGWHDEPASATSEAIEASPHFAGMGKTASVAALRAGENSDLHFRLLHSKPAVEGGWQLELRRGPSPLLPGAFQTVSRIVVGETTAEFAQKGVRVAGPVDLRQLVATETSVAFPGKKEVVRTVISAAGAVDMEEAGGGEKVPVPRKTEITTSIGRILATGAYEALAEPTANATATPGDTPPDPKQVAGDDFGKVIVAANGDRAGAPGQTVWIVADRGAKAADAQTLRRAVVDLHLLEADTALPDVSHSRLRFDRAELRLAFADGRPLEGPIAEAPIAEASSFIWLGALTDTGRRATFDLSRASLVAARDYDQIRLRFRFSDMLLAFTPQPVILPAREDCGVVVTPRQERADMSDEERGALPEPVRVDTRPVLVVEFDPQHIMEEAIFRPEPPPLPDIDLSSTQQAEAATKTPELAQREFIQKTKKENEAAAAGPTPFADFCKLFSESTETAGLTPEQRIYIGPDGLDPDAFEIARRLQMLSINATIASAINQLIQVQVAAQIVAILAAEQGTDPQPKPLPSDPDLRLELERKLESTLPLYSLFRNFYRDLLTGNSKDVAADPANGNALDAEYLHPNNRVGLLPEELQRAEARDRDARSKFVLFAAGRDEIPDIVEARLSGPTRLAFRINCRPGPGDSHDANGLPAFPEATPAQPGAAGLAFGAMPFTFAALTDWSHHEPAVTRRAEKLFREAPSGILPPLGQQAADLDDLRMLRHQGLTSGEEITGVQRMSEIRASLAEGPTALETAIEIPSRLILSTAQDAVWQSTRRFAIPRANSEFANAPAVLEHGETPTELGAPASSHSRDLWTARLLIDDVLPGLRVVGTPDFRPMALQPAQDGEEAPPGHFAPPRGAYAPWFIGAEQSNTTARSPLQAHVRAFPDDAGNWQTADGKWKPDAELCEAEPNFPTPRKLRLVNWLCRRLGIRTGTEAEIKFFRTSLDAYDRHELLLLSSAFGLPVTGKRKAVGENVEVGGALVDGSGQFEPGKQFALLDGRNDEAIYRPVPLSPTELTLSTLGGSFTHDTHFNPPATALDIGGRPFFSGLSIERWQHQIVLGRDIRAEVVYKGYLFPLGHRASLVKLTERIFLLTKTQGYKALLRQRMFLRIGKPDKKYPAVGQPNAGRQWCASDVLMLTRRTPDIVDPTTPLANAINTSLPPGQLAESPNGSLDLAGFPGLAFWPKLDLTDQGKIPFQFALDGKQTSMPLLFLDNVAATTPASVKKVADHYNTMAGSRRSMQMQGQKLRFAEEMESGDTTFATETVLVQAQGRRHPGGAQWGGNNALYETTGVLEGAEQPPFYPAVETATIHIEQVERLTGSGVKATGVRYDGHFLENGLKSTRAAASDAAAAGNPLEVFLNLIDKVRLDMGGSGDRSGGIARPNSVIYALSRSKGPLGADNPGYQAEPKSSLAPIDKITSIVSLAEYFRRAAPRPKPSTAAAVAAPSDQANDAAQLEVFEKFFSDDAKLLGIIKLRDLMKLFDLAGADLPLLQETMEFGSALQGAASDALSLVRVNVLLPLKAAVETIAEQWDALDKRLAEAQPAPAQGKPLSIKTYFPEIDEGLNGLDSLLDAALAENDVLKLPKKLSTIYESGKRFARLLATLAANAPERVQEAVRDQLLNGISDILGAKTALEATLDKLQAIKTTDPAMAVAAAAAELISAIEFLDDLIPLPVPTPDLLAAVRVVGGTASELAEAEDQARQVVDMLRAVVAADRADLRKQIAEIVARLGNGETDFEAATTAVAKLLIDEARRPLAEATEFIEDEVDDPYRTRLLEAVAAYSARLDQLELAIANASKAFPPALSQLLADLRRFRDAAESIKTFIAAVRQNDIDAALSVAAQIARRLFGTELDIAGILKAPGAIAAGSLDTLAEALRFTSGGATAWPTDAEAEAAVSLPEDLPADSVVLKKIAAAWKSVGEIDAALVAARTEFDDHKDDLASDALRTAADGVLTDTTILSSKIKLQIGFIYRHTVHLGRGLQAVQRSLHDIQGMSIGNGAGDTLNPANLLQRLETARALVEVSLDGLSTAFSEIVSALVDYLGKPNNQAALAGAFAATLIGSADIANAFKTLETRLKAAESAIVDSLADVIGLTLTLLSKGGLFANSSFDALKQPFAALPEVFNPERDAVISSLTDLADALPRDLLENFEQGGNPQTLEDLLSLPVKKVGPTTVRQFFIEGGANKEFDQLRARLRTAEVTAGNAYRSLLARAAAAPQALLNKAFGLASPALRPLADSYATVLAARDRVLKDPAIAQGLASELVVEALTVAPHPDFPCEGEGCDRLKQEADWLKAVADASDFGQTAIRKQLNAFLDGWLTGGAAPLVIAENLKTLVVKATSGDILSMIDVAALRDEIEDALANLVPLRTTLAYDVNLATGDYGAGESKGKIFSLMKGSRFDVAVKVDIDLLGKEAVKFRADAKLGAFQVNLLGGIFDAVALKFHGASFLIEDGGKPSFDVDYNTFEIGEKLKFAQKLQSFLSPSGSGFYLQPLDGLPGIEAGYGINLGTIQLGGISFSNVSLNVAALLPFTDSEALFRASLARRLAPFTISVPPFGGAGYFAITASAKKIVGFEASFEFGGSADFSFGPLVAYGRIMSGFYIRTQELSGGQRVTELSGTFFAGGAASIWIFNFYASLYVKLGMTPGGGMEGEAIFSFAFSMGIVDYDYSVRAASSQPAMGSGGGGGSSQSGALESPTRFAGLTADGIDRSIITGAIPVTPEEYGFVTGVRANTVCQAKDTTKYAGYFDLSLVENV